jgi:hypothetical protein
MGDGMLHLPLNLQINWNTRPRVHADNHFVISSFVNKLPVREDCIDFRSVLQYGGEDVQQANDHASRGYPAALMHFQIACIDHVIDAICPAPPKIAVDKRQTRTTLVY